MLKAPAAFHGVGMGVAIRLITRLSLIHRAAFQRRILLVKLPKHGRLCHGGPRAKLKRHRRKRGCHE